MTPAVSYLNVQMLQAISNSLRVLKRLSTTTKSGANSHALVSWLITKLPLTASERDLIKDHPLYGAAAIKGTMRDRTLDGIKDKMSRPTGLQEYVNAYTGQVTGTPMNENMTIAPLGMGESAQALEFQLDWDDIDLGGLEQIWDWEALNIDILPPEESWKKPWER